MQTGQGRGKEAGADSGRAERDYSAARPSGPGGAAAQRQNRQARVGILPNANRLDLPPKKQPPLIGRWMRLRSTRRPPTDVGVAEDGGAAEGESPVRSDIRSADLSPEGAAHPLTDGAAATGLRTESPGDVARTRPGTGSGSASGADDGSAFVSIRDGTIQRVDVDRMMAAIGGFEGSRPARRSHLEAMGVVAPNPAPETGNGEPAEPASDGSDNAEDPPDLAAGTPTAQPTGSAVDGAQTGPRIGARISGMLRAWLKG